MQNKKINLVGIKGKMSRDEMKHVIGGSGFGGGGGYFKCCWNGTSNCSVCVYLSTGNGSCVSGAYLSGC